MASEIGRHMLSSHTARSRGPCLKQTFLLPWAKKSSSVIISSLTTRKSLGQSATTRIGWARLELLKCVLEYVDAASLLGYLSGIPLKNYAPIALTYVSANMTQDWQAGWWLCCLSRCQNKAAINYSWSLGVHVALWILTHMLPWIEGIVRTKNSRHLFFFCLTFIVHGATFPKYSWENDCESFRAPFEPDSRNYNKHSSFRASIFSC